MANGTVNLRTWKRLGSITGTTAKIGLSGVEYSEILVVVDINKSGNKEIIYVIKEQITSATNWYRAGGYTSVATPVLVTIVIGSYQVGLTNASLGSNDYSSNTELTVYYR